MIAAARAAGRILVRNGSKVDGLSVSRKGRGDFVSGADVAAEMRIAEILHHRHPGHGFLMEEKGSKWERKGKRRFIVDPLDGTTNFLHGVPYFAVSIALQEKDRIEAGVVFDPLRREMFSARRGGGSYLNGRKLAVSKCREISESLVSTGVPILQTGQEDNFSQQLDALRETAGGLRRMGAAALDLAYVAAGRYDGYWEEGQAPWDIAAGILLVEEAGGRCSDLAGKYLMLRSGVILASNRFLHQPLLEALSRRTRKQKMHK